MIPNTTILRYLLIAPGNVSIIIAARGDIVQHSRRLLMTDNQPDGRPSMTAMDELRAINNLLHRICQVQETNHIMNIIIGDLAKVTEADQGIINLIERTEGDELSTVVRSLRPEVNGLPYKVSSQISGWVLKNRQMLKIDNLDNDQRFKGLSSNDGQIKSIICCPMIVRNEIIGLTTLVHGAAKGPFSDDQCRLAGILASQSAQILSNAILLEELARNNELLELSRRKLKEENTRLQRQIASTVHFENIIGKSPAIKKVLILVSKFSANDAPVLITGDTGTGKELIARAIHAASKRKDKPFVVKNCGVKTETLLESELFGHTRGSFTGAMRDKIGLFKEADGGTIFLDEIADAPLTTQAAILRVIQQGEIRPIGATKTEYVDVRVISATNKDLKERIRKSDFREDLFYRLSTFVIELPPLNQRKEDIPLLVNYFLRKLRIKLGNESLSISPAVMEILTKYHWPGNIRQLENELERAAVICDSSGQIDVRDLSQEIIISANGFPDISGYRGRLRDIIEKVEREIIRFTLYEHKGNILQTSKILGLTRKGLKDKMSRYKITYESQ
jgi:transcriptional regulator with GAF, ATPase, and Fis domain